MPLPSAGGGSSGESPVSSLERNIKPSDILRQKSSENLESKYAANRKTTPELSKLAQTPELIEELGRKMVGKTDSLDHSKRNDGGGGGVATAANGGSLGRTASTPGRALTPASGGGRTVGASPTGSLTKTAKLAAADSSSTSSLEKKSRVSLQASDAEAPVSAQRNVGSKESLASQGISEVVSGINGKLEKCGMA